MLDISTLHTFYPKSIEEWRLWLSENHHEKENVWLICYKQKSNFPSISWSDAVDVALCFGWIDSVRKTVDEVSFIQFYSKRKPTSTWSKINKEKVHKLIAEGLMTEAGLRVIDVAKKNGTWSILDTVEALEIPPDLELMFESYQGSKAYFLNQSKTAQKMMLHWVVMAKRPETRLHRITEIAQLAAQGKRPKHVV